ncbi:MAG: dTMP kinase [SAR324 cluster bacterium]|nr:dTMP kinase [SAR324 cluster bacterium]
MIESQNTINNNKRGLLISFDGIDGCGKTTQLHRVRDWLDAQGYQVLCTRQPGGTTIGQKIRAILLDPAHTHLVAQSELLLYLADRLQHLHEQILPAVRSGEVVLCDRFHDATIAYQGYGRQLDLSGIQSIVKEWIAPHFPDFTILLEITPEMAMHRIQERKQAEGDRLDQESLAFFQRVAGGYAALAKEEPKRFIRVDASKSIGRVSQAIIAALSKHLDTII